MNIQIFKYDDVEIEFDFRQGKNMMVNATEMANAFGKKVTHFLENENTENFILACLNSRNSDFLAVKNREDLVFGKQKSGTWMHRILALKFAAWLNPDFEVWVYYTIDRLLYEFANEIEESISESILLQREQDAIRNKLAKENPEFLEYLTLEQKIINSKNRRRNATINKFRERTADLFSQSKEI